MATMKAPQQFGYERAVQLVSDLIREVEDFPDVAHKGLTLRYLRSAKNNLILISTRGDKEANNG